jgi:fructokinase
MIVVFDIGGTKTRISYSNNGTDLMEPRIFATPHDFDQGMELLKKGLDQMVGGQGIEYLVGAVAGSLTKNKDELFHSPHLTNWENKPIKNTLTKLTGAKVFLENDAALAGLAEANMGSGKDKKIVAYLTIGTGVGGVRLVGGKIDESMWGFEPGHQILGNVFKDPGKSEELKYYYLDELVGGAGIKFRLGKDPEEITDEHVWKGITDILAIGINNIIVSWSPNVVVLGGGLITSGKIDVTYLTQRVQKIFKIFPQIPEIKKAEIGEFSALHGCLILVKQKSLPI